MAHVCRALSFTELYYRWRNEYGGLTVDQIKRFKNLERENTHLKRAVADPLPRNARHPEMLHA
jgi:putative transposase